MSHTTANDKSSRPAIPGPIALLQQAVHEFRINFFTFLGITVIPYAVALIGLLLFFGWARTINNFTPTTTGILVLVPLTLYSLILWTGNAMFQFLLVDQQTKNVFKIYSATFKRLRAILTTNLLIFLGGIILFCLYSAIAIMSRGVVSFDLSGGSSGYVIGAYIIFFGISLAVLFVPVWILVKLMFTQAVVMKEGEANFAAMRRSWVLTKGVWWRIFWRLVALSIFFAACTFLVNAIINAAFHAKADNPDFLTAVVSLLNEVIFGSLGYILIARLYSALSNNLTEKLSDISVIQGSSTQSSPSIQDGSKGRGKLIQGVLLLILVIILFFAGKTWIPSLIRTQVDRWHTAEVIQAAFQKTRQECLQTNTTAAVCNTILGGAQLQSCGDSSCWAAVMHTQYETIYAAKMLVHRDARGHYEVSDYVVTARQPQAVNGSSGFRRH